MEDKIIDILKEFNEDIIDFEGENLYKSGLLDSFQVIDLVAELEEAFDIEIDPDLVIVDNFANKEAIINLVKNIIK